MRLDPGALEGAEDQKIILINFLPFFYKIVTGIGDYTGEKRASFVINPKAVKLSSLKAGSKKLTVKWTRGKGIDGYEIQYGLKKDFKDAKTVTIKKDSMTETDIKKLKANKKYYVRIRAFRNVDGTTYVSAWSNVRNARIRK